MRRTKGGNGGGILRIDFPGGAGEEELEQIDWEEWFRRFDEHNLAFVYQERKASGEDSDRALTSTYHHILI